MSYCRLLAFFAQTCLVCAQIAAESPILNEITARPRAAASDFYKLAHQSVFGPGHIIKNKDSARDYLLSEMAALGPALPGERLIEEIGGGMVRVNLRPFRDSKGPTEDLLSAMIETANANDGTPKAFADKIAEACRVLIEQNKKELADELKSLAEKQAASNYPALRHSDIYRTAYLPAYRVVDKSFLSQDFVPHSKQHGQ